MTSSPMGDATRYVGQSVSFIAVTSGSEPLSCQWRKDGVEIIGATNASYSIAAVSTSDAGTYSVVLDGACNTVSTHATLTVTGCLPLTSDTPQYNRQVNLFDQKARITNSTSLTFAGLQITVDGLRAVESLYNASGTNAAGLPFVTYNQEIGPGQTVELTIEYFSKDRQTPQPQLCAQAVSQTPSPQPEGKPVTIDRIMPRSDGTCLIEFPAVPGQSYFIQYCDDFVHWKTATPGVSSSANYIQWIDNGPPKTESLPGSRPSRFYRVITAQSSQ